MGLIVSTKGGDITTWRAADNFTTAYRQALLDWTASDHNGSAESVFSGSLAALKNSMETHRSLRMQLDSLCEEGAAAPPVDRLKELTIEYYDVLYRHMDIFHSAPAFYQKSMDFVKMLTAVIMDHATEQLGPRARHLPKMALVALGPAGRCEYSPFCQLQLLLVHEEVTASQLQAINRYCHILHTELEATGLAVDPVITPRNPEWRGSIAEWRHRCDEESSGTKPDSLIAVLRLADQYPLASDEKIAQELKEVTIAGLRKSHAAQANLIERMASLSNGLGIMGRLKLERNGAERGLFRLLDHGLLPLSAALSALALIKMSSATSSCERILDLLERRELDVELVETMLTTWHSLHELRLRREQFFSFADHTKQPVLLNPGELSIEQRHSLKTALTSVSAIQRHVAIIFSGTEE